MDCSKCGHSQDNTVKCESCGVYFAKLAAPAPTSRQVVPSAPASRGFGVGTVALAAVAAAGLVYHLMRQNPTPQIPATPAPNLVAPAPAVGQVVNVAAAAHSDATGVDAVAAARSATVFIRTAWGL